MKSELTLGRAAALLAAPALSSCGCPLVSRNTNQRSMTGNQTCVAQLGTDDAGTLLACCVQVKLPPGDTFVQPLAQSYAHGGLVAAGCRQQLMVRLSE